MSVPTVHGHGTQALADAAATDGGSDFTAHQGASQSRTDGRPDGSITRSMARGALTDADDLPEVGQRKYAATVALCGA